MKTTVSFLFSQLLALSIYAQSQPISISKILINHRVDTGGAAKNTIALKALHDDLVIEFAVQDSLGHDSIFFKLDGYDKEWTKTIYPIARYTHLQGGAYSFFAKTQKDTSYLLQRKITVERALTEEVWFYPIIAVCLTMIGAAVFYFWNIYNLRQKLKIQTIRNHIASDIHDEIGATMSSVAITIRTIQKRVGKNAPEIEELLEKIRKAAEHTNLNLRDTVWSINPSNDSFEKILERMKSFAFQILPDVDILCKFENTVDMNRTFTISMEQRQNVYMIFKEAVNNIAKHSGATKANITLTQEKEGILLTIADNGKGFDVAANFEGNGLKNYRRRAKDSFIEFDIKSSPNNGTTITLLIPEL